jgi:Mlc titration factor MtfA (ptsG expression regulator)
MLSFLQRLFQHTDDALIDDLRWNCVVHRHKFLATLNAQELVRLRALACHFLHRKAITAVSGTEIDITERIAIAAQACLPVLNLSLDAYDAFSEVVVYPSEFFVRREIADEHGVVHDDSGLLYGETMPGGPVVISWNENAQESADVEGARGGINVVIHEFAHKLDLANGDANGIPRFMGGLHDDLDTRAWIDALHAAYDDLCAMVDALEARFPRHLDPESSAGLALYAALPLDAYAAQDPAEFFAVASEAYFLEPARLEENFTEFFDLLDRYYRPRLKPQP